MRALTICLTTFLLLGCASKTGDEALGTLERDRVILKATASELIVSQPIPEGTMVAAGSLLVQLDDRRQQA